MNKKILAGTVFALVAIMAPVYAMSMGDFVTADPIANPGLYETQVGNWESHQSNQQRKALDIMNGCPIPPEGGYRFVTYIPDTENARIKKAKYFVVSDGVSGDQIVNDLNSRYGSRAFELISHRQPHWGFTWIRYLGA